MTCFGLSVVRFKHAVMAVASRVGAGRRNAAVRRSAHSGLFPATEKGNEFVDRRIQGFSLLEAMVTLVVVSVGILGILGLQTASLVNTRTAALRSNAIVVANNFAQRMQANPSADYDGITSNQQIDNNAHCDAITGNAQPSGTITNLSPAQVKKVAVCEWSETLQDELPNGRGYVECINGAPCGYYAITIAWFEKPRNADKSGSSGNNANTNQNSDKHCGDDKNTNRCFVLEVRL